MGRGKRLALNSIMSLVLQITTIICGFILPRLMLQSFGSEVNGLVYSITQFLVIIAFLELGVGAVVQSALYKPLAEKDSVQISKIISSANNFFQKLAIMLLVYVLILLMVYPLIINATFSAVYTGTLILAMSISSFAQYYFGVVDRLLLTADQRGYIQYTAQIITMILNTIACVALIKLGMGIQIVKLSTSVIYLLLPLYLRIYVNKHYDIDRTIYCDVEPIKQKWNGVAQHVAAVVLDNTDIIVLTLFSTLSNVSIYGVYHLVVNSVKTLFISMSYGIQALLGELWAKKELDDLKKAFEWTEWTIHTGVIFVFGCTASLVVPFVRVYTSGVIDTNYIVPAFALLITLANGMHCLRLPYHIMILAVGHYKQTQSNYIIAMMINIIVSIITVKAYSLIGVAVGTLVAMVYQTVWMAWYDSKNFLKESMLRFFKHIFIDIITFVIAFMICSFFSLRKTNIISWVILAVQDALVWAVVVIVMNLVFFPLYTKKIFRITLNRIIKRKKEIH